MLFVYHAGGGAQGRPAEIKPIIQCAEERSGSAAAGETRRGCLRRSPDGLKVIVFLPGDEDGKPVWGGLSARATERTMSAGRGRAFREVSALSRQPGGNVAWRGRNGTQKKWRLGSRNKISSRHGNSQLGRLISAFAYVMFLTLAGPRTRNAQLLPCCALRESAASKNQLKMYLKMCFLVCF